MGVGGMTTKSSSLLLVARRPRDAEPRGVAQAANMRQRPRRARNRRNGADGAAAAGLGDALAGSKRFHSGDDTTAEAPACSDVFSSRSRGCDTSAGWSLTSRIRSASCSSLSAVSCKNGRESRKFRTLAAGDSF